jgi:uncharacterized SAM-binding protein YcdF (DUF218 family)
VGDISARNFGLLIAYIIPGFIALAGLGFAFDPIARWLVADASNAPNLGAFLYAMLASLGAGMAVSSVRWALLDSAHHSLGIQRPNWDDSRLDRKLAAFDYIVENHYRYYQFYGNTLIAVLFSWTVWHVTPIGIVHGLGWPDLGIFALEVILLAGSRDTLRKYYARTSRLLGAESEVSNDEWEPRRRGSGQQSGRETPGAAEADDKCSATEEREC